MIHQKYLIRPCISGFGFTNNSSLSPYLSCQRIVLCRLRSSTSTSLIKDDDNDNEEEEEANTSYVVKKVKSAPISSLFMGNNNRNNKQTASTTTPRRRRGRSRSDTRSEQQHYNGLNGSSSNSNSKKKISGSSLQHYFTRPSRIGNPTVYTTEAINTKIEEGSSNNSSILKQYIIEPVIRALQQFTSAIGFTNVTSNNTIMNSLLLPSTSRQRYHDINRSKRRYQCNECGYQVKRWTSLLSRMQHCAHCTTSVDTSSELDPKDFAIYLNDEDYTTSYGKSSNNMSFEWRRINSYQNNLRQQQKKRKMTKEMKLERFRSNNGYVIPQMYRTPIKEEETVTAEAPISPKASSSSHQQKENVESRKHNTSKIVKRRKKKLYQCEECGQATKLWKHFRAMKRDCTLCDTRAGLKRTDFLRILNNIR